MRINELNTGEKILLAEELWDSVRACVDAGELIISHHKVLVQRLAEVELNPDERENWDSVKALLSAL